jgi:Tfp pilus assembly protein PilN
LHDRKGALSVGVQQDVAIELPPEVTDLYAPEVAEPLRARTGGFRGPLAVVVPADLCLFRALRLPSNEPAELRGMAELQVDKFSPFLPEHSAVALEVLEQREGESLVLLATIQRDYIDRLGALCAKAGLFPREVDVDILGWWKLLTDAGKIPAAGRHVFVFALAEGATLVVADEGRPLVIRPLGAGLPAADVAEELQYTLTTMETEWGVAPLGPVQLWYEGELSAELAQALQATYGGTPVAAALGELPPVTEGLARRAAARTPLMLDLAPPDWRSSLANLRTRKQAMMAGGVILGVWLAGAAVLMGGVYFQNSRLRAVRGEVKAQQKPLAEVRELRAQIEALERYGNRSRSALESLREICERMPDGVELTFLSYSKTGNFGTNAPASAVEQRYAAMSLRGDASSSEPVYSFFGALEQSGMFKKVSPESVTEGVRDGQSRSQFRVTIELGEDKS